MKNINWLVAEKVMDLKYDGDLPYYSTDLAAAWQIDKPGWRWDFEEEGSVLFVTLWRYSSCIAQVVVKWSEVPDKATAYCLGRCRAALEAVGVNLEAENDL